ncbi:MAG: hypothetical protein EOO78_07110 [Oxalobacteraceae bacterium]|nr:MAG: hypothetical protein EOO78_07110 [Oxalobacteraceae bacterium]
MQQPRRRHFLIFTGLALGLMTGSGAHAEDGAGAATGASLALSPSLSPSLSVSGFGTVGLVHASERHADFTSSVLKKHGAGATQRWSADVDTRLGLQLDLALSKRWSAVLQVVSEQDLDNSYRPRVEWANIKYQVTPELALRVGRMALPMFLAAEYRKVGYIYPWVRPPVEAYGSMPFTSGDGADINYRWSLGPLRNVSQVFYGYADVGLGKPLRAYGRRIAGLANTSDWGALSVRASVIDTEATSDIVGELFDAFDAFGPAGAAITRAYAIDHKRFSVASLGVSYDPGGWFAMAEANRTLTHSLLGATRSVYASAGWRQGSFTPYLTWSRVHPTSATSDPGLPLAGLPPALAARAAALNQVLNGILATIPAQTSSSAGVRWDLRANMALKLQYDRVTPDRGSRGTLINQTPGFLSGRATHVASVALDFVY